MSRTFNENNAIRMSNTPAVYAAASVTGTFVDMTGFRRATLITGNGELDGDMPVQVMEATDTSGTSAQALSGLTGTFTNGTDEARVGVIEVREADLSSGFKTVGARVIPAATDSFFGVWVLSDAYENPVDNATGDGVAFNVGE